jgi:hypothetical protein
MLVKFNKEKNPLISSDLVDGGGRKKGAAAER